MMKIITKLINFFYKNMKFLLKKNFCTLLKIGEKSLDTLNKQLVQKLCLTGTFIVLNLIQDVVKQNLLRLTVI